MKKNEIELAKNLDQFKQNGIVVFKNILSIPSKDRLPGLVQQYGKEKIHGILVILLTEFSNSFNLIRPMTADQIVSCAFELITASYEDNLGIEDFVIFFSGAKSAKYGKILDRLDQQTIFDLFENYREQRHREYLHIKEEKTVQYKGLGPTERSSDEKEVLEDNIRAEIIRYYKENAKPDNG